MEQSPVYRALSKKMQPEVVNMVLQLIEGFAPKGVDKSIWRRILENWNNNRRNNRRGSEWNGGGNRYANPKTVRIDIECYNLLLGPLVWHVRMGDSCLGPLADRLCAKPPIDQRLVDAAVTVYLERRTRRRPIRSHCRILEVNEKGTAFRHSNPELWCRLADVDDIVVEVPYIWLRDTSD